MVNIGNIPSHYTEDYKTLHHDIGLFRRGNGTWDLWFGQDNVSDNFKDDDYLSIVEGDIVSATEIHSLQVGIIISCLTSWNYLNRTENPLYTEFGNEAYSLLKRNKGKNTRFKIEQFFIDCLNRMRRIYSIESLDVYDVEGNPYMYKVVFKVLSVTNTLVDGEFYLDTDSSKTTTVLDINYNHPYSSVANPLSIECELKDEYGGKVEGEILYIYVKNDYDSKFKFYGVTESTNEDGCAYITIPPNGLSLNTQIMVVFKGNSLYNPCSSKIITIQNVAYYIKSRYIYKTIEVDGRETRVVDKHILYVEDSMGNSTDKFKLGELLSDYVYIDKINLKTVLNIDEISNYYKSEDNPLVMGSDGDDYDVNKVYLIPTDKYIDGVNKVYYKAYCWDKSGDSLFLTDYLVQLNTDNPDEIHFLIDDGDNGLFEINFDDGHLYYHIDLIDNEM